MNPSNVNKFQHEERIPENGKWCIELKGSFRTHLFQLIGSWEVAQFFLVAPFNNQNLWLLRTCQENSKSRKEFINTAKDMVRMRRWETCAVEGADMIPLTKAIPSYSAANFDTSNAYSAKVALTGWIKWAFCIALSTNSVVMRSFGVPFVCFHIKDTKPT